MTGAFRCIGHGNEKRAGTLKNRENALMPNDINTGTANGTRTARCAALVGPYLAGKTSPVSYTHLTLPTTEYV